MAFDFKLVRESESRKNVIQILFDPRVTVFKSSLTHDLLTLTANIGGSVGLVLGISMIQMYEKFEMYSMSFIMKVKNPLKYK